MEERPLLPMERTRKILRRSIYTFLQQYQYFTSTAALLAFPFSASILLVQAFIPSSSSALLPTIYSRLRSLFDAAGFPSSSDFFFVLNLKLSQTFLTSIFTLPFTLSFLLLAKASVIQVLNHNHQILPPTLSSVSSLYSPLLLTYVFNSFLILSANATAFSILFFAFNIFEGFGFSSANFILFLSATGAVIYSIILANVLIICNFALVSSGMERCGGYLTILKACVLIRGRASMALSLALPCNLAMAGIEALFQYRVVRPYHLTNNAATSMALEAGFIAYLYSILIVLDTIVSWMFVKTCKTAFQVDHQVTYSYQIQVTDGTRNNFAEPKALEELP